MGTNSVGYAVTDENYRLLRKHGDAAWGVNLFKEGETAESRRAFRTSRRREDRVRFRIQLLQEQFAHEIASVDPQFYVRLKESYMVRSDASSPFGIFNDPDFTDKDYHKKYPTIHHLIDDLMTDPSYHDPRLVYLACSWLMKHRGHFNSGVREESAKDCLDFNVCFGNFEGYFLRNGYSNAFADSDRDAIRDAMTLRDGPKKRYEQMAATAFRGKKLPKFTKEEFPYDVSSILHLFCGGSVKPKKLFGEDAYNDLDSFSLDMSEEKFDELSSFISEEDYSFVEVLRSVYDWSILDKLLNGSETISRAMINIYDEHRRDRNLLRGIIRKYVPEKYCEVFDLMVEKKEDKEDKKVKKAKKNEEGEPETVEETDAGASEESSEKKKPNKTVKGNYAGYINNDRNGNSVPRLVRGNHEVFSKYLHKILLDEVLPKVKSDKDRALVESMIRRLEAFDFLRKPNSEYNRVIPHQLYLVELRQILNNAACYLPTFSVVDDDNMTPVEKIVSVFNFRIPYFVGPLNPQSEFAWIVRQPEKIYPWNFDKVVNFDASEEQFIRRMTATCSYCPGEPVLPKFSLLYRKYMVLNEINVISVNGGRLSTEIKQDLFNNLFLQKKNVTKKAVENFLIDRGVINKGEGMLVGGLAESIGSNLSSHIAFRKLISGGIITEDDAERIIERNTFSSDKLRLNKWLVENYPQLSEEDRKYLCNLSFKDFGSFSKMFLTGIVGKNKKTKEDGTILDFMWNYQVNLMELMSSAYTFKDVIRNMMKEYYADNPMTVSDRLSSMYVFGSARRSVFRALSVVKDVVNNFGEPEKIFIEVPSSFDDAVDSSNRKKKILDLYKSCEKNPFLKDDVARMTEILESLGDDADAKLCNDTTYLYFLQFGRSMFSWEFIDFRDVNNRNVCNQDHIYPRSLYYDNSFNNLVLVKTSENSEKDRMYPISHFVQEKMSSIWKILVDAKAISHEKYRRLTRTKELTIDEKLAFANAQGNATTMAEKGITAILSELYPRSEIIYNPSYRTVDFRNEYRLFKSRLFNDLHSAVDAYLDIVIGNVYNMKFGSRAFDPDANYSIKIPAVFGSQFIINDKVIWGGRDMLEYVKATASKNTAHAVYTPFMKNGKIFNMMIVGPKDAVYPVHEGMDISKYGGYSDLSAKFFLLAKFYSEKGKEEPTEKVYNMALVPVDMIEWEHVLSDKNYALKYVQRRLAERMKAKDLDWAKDISFPIGLIPLKPGTTFEFDGLRCCLSGLNGRAVSFNCLTQFSADPFWQFYLKKLERFWKKVSEAEKRKNAAPYVYSEEHDKVSVETNNKLYDVYLGKLRDTVYKHLPNNPYDFLFENREVFQKLSVQDQSCILLNIHAFFCRDNSSLDFGKLCKGRNLSGNALSIFLGNWKKRYSDVRIVFSSAAGLHETKSENLLSLF